MKTAYGDQNEGVNKWGEPSIVILYRTWNRPKAWQTSYFGEFPSGK